MVVTDGLNHLKQEAFMEGHDQELVQRLLAEDADFKKTYKSHKDCENKLEKLEKIPRLTPEDKTEKNRLKKLKLTLKDEMEGILKKIKAPKK